MTEPVVYTMAIIKDGKIIATKAVRTYLEGAAKAITPDANELKMIEHAWMVRGIELARDVLHHEGRFEAMYAAQKSA